MNSYKLEKLSAEEISALRQSLNVIDIKGSSAQFIATLQIKLDNKISQIQNELRQEETKKQSGIKKIERSTKSKS